MSYEWSSTRYSHELKVLNLDYNSEPYQNANLEAQDLNQGSDWKLIRLTLPTIILSPFVL
jgi:hypothetical protein